MPNDVQQNNLLVHLHKWAYRQDENFLTDAFAHLLRHLRDNEPWVACLLLCNLTAGRLKLGVSDVGDVSITTQVTTEQGRPDIEIRTADSLVYVEAKQESMLGRRQLTRYHQDLHKDAARNKCLVLLTRYPVEIRNDAEPDVSRRWYQIADWLEECEERITDPKTRFVTNQFVEFLKARNIAMEKAGPELAAGVKSLRNVLKMLEEAIKIKTGNSKGYCKFKPERDEIGFHLDNETIWIGIHYEDPTAVCCETLEVFSVTKDAEGRAECGDVKKDDNGLYWSHQLTLDSAFFGLSKDEQLDRLAGFVGECIAATDKIKER